MTQILLTLISTCTNDTPGGWHIHIDLTTAHSGINSSAYDGFIPGTGWGQVVSPGDSAWPQGDGNCVINFHFTGVDSTTVLTKIELVIGNTWPVSHFKVFDHGYSGDLIMNPLQLFGVNTYTSGTLSSNMSSSGSVSDTITVQADAVPAYADNAGGKVWIASFDVWGTGTAPSFA